MKSLKFSSKPWHPLFGNKVLFQQAEVNINYKVMVAVTDKKFQLHAAASEQSTTSSDGGKLCTGTPRGLSKLTVMLQHLINIFVPL
jgi:hypothetical protein